MNHEIETPDEANEKTVPCDTPSEGSNITPERRAQLAAQWSERRRLVRNLHANLFSLQEAIESGREAK